MPALATPTTGPDQDQAYWLDRLYKATPEVVQSPPLNREDYNTHFWERSVWKMKTARAPENPGEYTSGVPGLGVNSSFLEDKDGIRPQLPRQKEILEEVHTTWRTMKEFNIELKPKGSMTAPARQYFCSRMELKCPELRLCSNHWKAEQLWKENFSSWSPVKTRKGAQLQNNGDQPPQPRGGRRKLYVFFVHPNPC